MIKRLKNQFLAIDDSILILRHVGEWSVPGASNVVHIGENQRCVQLTPWYINGPTKLEVVTEKAAKLRLRLQHRNLMSKAHTYLDGMQSEMRVYLSTSSRWSHSDIKSCIGENRLSSNGLSTLVRYIREGPDIYNGPFNYENWSIVNQMLKMALEELDVAIPIATEDLKYEQEAGVGSSRSLAADSAESMESLLTVRTTVCDMDVCPLCCSDNKGSLRSAECGHVYCGECLDALQLRMSVCPQCRADFTDGKSSERRGRNNAQRSRSERY